MPIKPPSRVQSTTVPIFALKWHTSPYITPSHILAYAGGGGSAKTGIGNTIQIEIDSDKNQTAKIDTGVEIGVALDILVTSSMNCYVAVGISDSVRVYMIEETNAEGTGGGGDADANTDADAGDNDAGEGDVDGESVQAVLIASYDFEKGSGVNAVAWNALGDAIVAGREDGKVSLLSATFDTNKQNHNPKQLTLEPKVELSGHVKAICSCAFHPRNPGVFVTAAKDGTSRVWNLGLETEDKCMEILECRIYDPNGPKPPAKILNPKPGQLLVRGCAFGDLDGRTIYTVQSGRKGGAFLSVWKLVRTPVDGEKEVDKANPNGPPVQKFKFEFKEAMRKQVSKFPVSAVSLSGDYSTLVLGDTDGSITLLSTETFKPLKFFECAHDLPVTCIAARPLPLPMAGEELTGVAVDAISASADNKLCYVTKQRKSTLKKKKKPRKGGGSKPFSLFSIIWYLFYLAMFAVILYVCKVSVDVCRGEVSGGLFDDIGGVKQCVFNSVLWASSDRPGVAFIPY